MIEKLKDIKPNTLIPDNSLVIGVSLFVFMIALTLIYFFIKKPKRKRKPTHKELKLKALKELDFSDEKELSYRFTTDAYIFLDDKNTQKYHQIVKELTPYKYKKKSP